MGLYFFGALSERDWQGFIIVIYPLIDGSYSDLPSD